MARTMAASNLLKQKYLAPRLAEGIDSYLPAAGA
jgi:hypothetical protein